MRRSPGRTSRSSATPSTGCLGTAPTNLRVGSGHSWPGDDAAGRDELPAPVDGYCREVLTLPLTRRSCRRLLVAAGQLLLPPPEGPVLQPLATAGADREPAPLLPSDRPPPEPLPGGVASLPAAIRHDLSLLGTNGLARGDPTMAFKMGSVRRTPLSRPRWQLVKTAHGPGRPATASSLPASRLPGSGRSGARQGPGARAGLPGPFRPPRSH